MKKSLLTLLVLLFCIGVYADDPTFTVENMSERTLTVKIMKMNSGLYKTIYIPAKSTRSVTIQDQGYYYTKTKAEKYQSETIYSKDDAFYVQNNYMGYSVLTVTYWVEESNYPQSSGQRISKSEFENDNK